MSEPVVVDDPTDPRLDFFRDLSNADRRPDRHAGKGMVVAEGVPVVQRMLASAYPVQAVMGVQAKVDQLRRELDGWDIAAYVVSVPTMDAVVGFHLNRGVLAVAERAVLPSYVDLTARASRLVVLEGVNDHENLGSLFRNAAAFGVDGVIFGPRCSDPLYRRAVRVSMGTVFRVPFVHAPEWPQTLYDLERLGFATLALTPYPPAVELRGLDPALQRVAIVLGAEGPGLTETTLTAVRRHVRIPMAPGVDSLNVATAAALALHHFS